MQTGKDAAVRRELASAPSSRAITGVLIGTAVGDAIGLPMEGLSVRRQQRLFPLPLRHRFIGRHGMTSDDTEHTAMLAQALLEHPADPDAFQCCFAWKLRWWLLSLPAGVGFATLRAILKLWAGCSPKKSGIYSAGNGPAMRSALLGVYFARDRERLMKYVQATSTITHSDPRATIAAQAVAETAAWMAEQRADVPALLDSLQAVSSLPEWTSIVEKLRQGLFSDQSAGEFATTIGAVHGVSGYAFQSVPVAIYAAVRRRDNFQAALTEAIACGGDSDTVGAITGALVGSRVGVEGIPSACRHGLAEWPRSMSFLVRPGERLEQQRETSSPRGAVPYFWPAIPLRNVLFLAIVLFHGFRRLAPPFR
ncbi:MAG: ADP-ribosylglycohydrolase family protein [Chthoniobacteraceae bacterium]